MKSLPRFKKTLQDDEKLGSKWYEMQIKAMIRNLICKFN